MPVECVCVGSFGSSLMFPLGLSASPRAAARAPIIAEEARSEPCVFTAQGSNNQPNRELRSSRDSKPNPEATTNHKFRSMCWTVLGPDMCFAAGARGLRSNETNKATGGPRPVVHFRLFDTAQIRSAVG